MLDAHFKNYINREKMNLYNLTKLVLKYLIIFNFVLCRYFYIISYIKKKISRK